MTPICVPLRRRRLGRRGPATAICSAARAPTSPRWRRSACRCRPASPSRPRCAPVYYEEGEIFPDDLRAAGRRRHRPYRAGLRQEVRRPGRSAARLGPLGRARVDAGHDGHGPQPRAQRRDRARASPRPPAIRASPGTAIAASSRCIPTSCSASTMARSRRRSRSPRRTRASTSTPTWRPTTGSG